MERSYRKLWVSLIIIITASFSVLGYFGIEIYRQAPPIPEFVTDTSGKTLFTGEDIREGQKVWQSTGGQELGSIWGHGAYVAPDWSADWLHREAVEILKHKANEKFQKPFESLSASEQA